MANAVPRLVRCPKCLKILSDIPGVAVYKCGGCGSILQAKVNSSSGKTSSSASATSSSKNMSDAGSFEHERSNFGKETQSFSHHSGSQDHVVKAKVSGANGELSISHEFSEDGTKNSAESESDAADAASSKEKWRSHVYEHNGVSLTEHNFNGKGKKSSQHAISPQYVDQDDEIFRKIRNESSFLMRSRSSHVNSPRKTIPRFDSPGRQEGISFSSEDFRSALNLTGSENGRTSESHSKDLEQFAKFRHPEKIVQEKILRKVDELRIELRRYFDRGASRLSVSARFEGKFPPIQHPSSFVPPSKQPPASYRPHNVHSHLSAGGGAASSHPLHREPRPVKKGDKRSHKLKCYRRPVSGGAPFVICNRCYNLLQLPADFLMLAKRVHKLRCGACSEVLSYTFRAKARPTAQTPSEARLPPSEDEKSIGEVLDVEISAAPRLNNIREGDPVSYSEDYNPFSGMSSSNGAVVEEDRGGKSSRKSKLHRLMGYSSARFLLFNSFSPSEGHRTDQDR